MTIKINLLVFVIHQQVAIYDANDMMLHLIIDMLLHLIIYIYQITPKCSKAFLTPSSSTGEVT